VSIANTVTSNPQCLLSYCYPIEKKRMSIVLGLVAISGGRWSGQVCFLSRTALVTYCLLIDQLMFVGCPVAD
jgi:hypothetical protein